jgi:hypothetical protein
VHILRIEHPVADYEEWKKLFDSDPIRRQESGVRRYRISRPVDEADYVMIDLEFVSREKAEAALAALRSVWAPIDGKVVMNPQTRIAEVVEAKEY